MRATKTRKQINMLEGRLWDKILLFALPLAATGILQQLFNASDIAIVGRFTGERGAAAMAAVGANSSLVSLIVNLFVGMALGANVVIARAVGQRDNDTISKAVHTSITFALIAGVCAAVVCQLFAAPILHRLRVPDEVLPMAVLYLRIYAVGLPVVLLYNFASAIFRAMGDTRTPLLVLACSGVINVALNLFFVIVIGLDVAGVATATVASNLISSAALLCILMRAKNETRLMLSHLSIDKRVFVQILRIGVPAGIQSAVFSLANVIIQSAINSLGTIVMAASSAAFNIEIFAYYVMNSFSQACTTFVGQNNGAEQYARCKKVLLLCILEDAVCLGLTVVLILSCGKSILGIFNTDPAVIETGYVRLVTIMLSYTFSMLYDNMAGYLRGFGISLTPALLTTAGICGVRIVWIFGIFPRHRAFLTIMLVYPVSLATTAVLIFVALICLRPAGRALARSRETT